jgi:hypothetical protein
VLLIFALVFSARKGGEKKDGKERERVRERERETEIQNQI